MIKQVIIIRRDLKMRRGKEIAQGAHASMMWISDRLRQAVNSCFYRSPIFSPEELEWLNGIFTKITLQIDSEAALVELHKKAIENGLTAYLVTDSGKTEFNGVPTITTCAIGPNLAEKIDEITKDLKLY